MIDMVRITDRFITPITASLLVFVLIANIFSGVRAIGVSFSSFVIQASRPNAIWIFFLPVCIVFLYAGGVLFPPFLFPLLKFLRIFIPVLTVLFANIVSIALAPSLVKFFDFIFILFTIFFSSCGYALSALTAFTRWDSFSWGKVFSRSRELLTALRANFHRGIHSVSLSLYLRRVSADGEMYRRFALQSLADKGNYTRFQGECIA